MNVQETRRFQKLRDLAVQYRNDVENRIIELREEKSQLVDPDSQDIDDQIAHWVATMDQIETVLRHSESSEQEMRRVRCMVACHNASGDPDLFFLIVVGTESQFADGRHYDRAKEVATEQGYSGDMVVFDEDDSVGRAILDKFEWDTASVSYCIVGEQETAVA